MSAILQEAVFSDCDYRLLSDDSPASLETMMTFDKKNKDNLKLYNDKIYKVIPADHAFDLGLYEEKVLKKGKIRKVKSRAVIAQNIIVTFSRKMMEYQRTIRNRQVKRAKAMLANIDPETYKKGPHDVTRFITRVSPSKEGKGKDIFELNRKRIEEEEKYDGFYAVATNLDDTAKTVLDISAGRYKIEECFRITKTNLSAHPVHHHRRERIVAHFMICYTALLIYRLLETKLNRYGTHFTIDNIIDTLNSMEVANIENICYMSTYTGSDVLTALNAVFDMGLDKKYYQPKELNKKIKKISN